VAQTLPPGAATPPAPPAPGLIYSRRPDVPPAPAVPSVPSATAQYASATEPPPLSDKVSVVPIAPTQIWIQAGAFATPENLTRAQTRLAGIGPIKVTGVKVSGTTVYRVRLGPAANVQEADRLLARVVDSGFPEARILVD
jgi:rare lipoprotein A